MDDSRLFIAIIALGLLAAVAKLLDLFDSEPIVVDARDNGGVSIADELHRYGPRR